MKNKTRLLFVEVIGSSVLAFVMLVPGVALIWAGLNEADEDHPLFTTVVGVVFVLISLGAVLSLWSAWRNYRNRES